MKTWIYLTCIFSGVYFCNAQPIIEENFIYPAGTLTQVSSNWVEDPAGTYDVQVIEGNLIYPAYPSSGAGNMIFLDAGSGRSGILRSFPIVSGNGRKIYLSFLMNLNDTLDATGAGFCRFKSFETIPKLYIHLQRVTGENKYRIGLSKTGINILYDPVLRNVGETHLIVASYHFKIGNDSIMLWINPDLADSLPPANLIFPSSTGDVANLAAFNFVQYTGSGNINIDGIRLDTSWSQSPLPVELSVFTGEIYPGKIILNWRTETEVDNYGFDLERLKSSRWEKIAFIEGHGNSNIPNNYSYIDEDVFNCSEILYRLKQIDTDGGFSYSDEITLKTIPSEFYLFQNYPNPFNPATKIRYNVPEVPGAGEADVKLILFNVLGKETAVLVNEKETAGIYEVKLDAEYLNIPAGVYFYSVQITYNRTGERFFAVKKMILLH